jgi:hypothetical protein
MGRRAKMSEMMTEERRRTENWRMMAIAWSGGGEEVEVEAARRGVVIAAEAADMEDEDEDEDGDDGVDGIDGGDGEGEVSPSGFRRNLREAGISMRVWRRKGRWARVSGGIADA